MVENAFQHIELLEKQLSREIQELSSLIANKGIDFYSRETFSFPRYMDNLPLFAELTCRISSQSFFLRHSIPYLSYPLVKYIKDIESCNVVLEQEIRYRPFPIGLASSEGIFGGICNLYIEGIDNQQSPFDPIWIWNFFSGICEQEKSRKDRVGETVYVAFNGKLLKGTLTKWDPKQDPHYNTTIELTEKDPLFGRKRIITGISEPSWVPKEFLNSPIRIIGSDYSGSGFPSDIAIKAVGLSYIAAPKKTVENIVEFVKLQKLRDSRYTVPLLSDLGFDLRHRWKTKLKTINTSNLPEDEIKALKDLQTVLGKEIEYVEEFKSQSRCYKIEDNHVVGLRLRSEKLDSLPDSFRNLKFLRQLDLSGIKLKEFKNLEGLNNLHELSLINNELQEFPESLLALTELRMLSLGHNQLTELPESLGKLVNLERLELYLNSLSDSGSDSLANLKNLKVLNLSSNQGIPDIFEKLLDLEVLIISNNKLRTFPTSIFSLNNLKKLILNNNHLSSLPTQFGNLVSLQFLDLSDNWLTSLPDTVANLSNLVDLNLKNNMLSRLPDSFGSLTTLKQLYLTNCTDLQELPLSFEELRNLELLDLSGTKLDPYAQLLKVDYLRNFLENLSTGVKRKTIDIHYLLGRYVEWDIRIKQSQISQFRRMISTAQRVLMLASKQENWLRLPFYELTRFRLDNQGHLSIRYHPNDYKLWWHCNYIASSFSPYDIKGTLTFYMRKSDKTPLLYKQYVFGGKNNCVNQDGHMIKSIPESLQSIENRLKNPTYRLERVPESPPSKIHPYFMHLKKNLLFSGTGAPITLVGIKIEKEQLQTHLPPDVFDNLINDGVITSEGVGLLNDPNLIAYVYLYCLDAFWIGTELDEGLIWNEKAFKETFSDKYSLWINTIGNFLARYGIEQRPTVLFEISYLSEPEVSK